MQKRNMLDGMLENNDISSDVYKKYKKRIIKNDNININYTFLYIWNICYYL